MTATRTTPVPSLKKKNPLSRYSLRGQAAALDERAVAQIPLLGDFALQGQGTVLAAPPNAGKTLITLASLIEAIEEKRIAGDDVFYVDADDTTQGVADKVRLLDEYGVNVIADGYAGFRTAHLAPALEQMIEDGSARGKLLILDTLKKFTQPMSKAETSRFTDVIRRFVLAGGTLVSLAHTNKSPDPEGRNVFAGVSDIKDDVDCLYVLDLKPEQQGKRIVQFNNKKRRGNNPDTVTYAYDAAPEIGYAERLTTVHVTNDYDEGGDDNLDYKATDDDILESLALSIHHGENRGKMELVRMVARLESASKRRVLRLLEAHTGEDPKLHRWRYVVRDRGLFAYELLGPLTVRTVDG